MKRIIEIIVFLCVAYLMVSCGGGGDGGGSSQPQPPISLEKSLRYFPYSLGNIWVSKETDYTDGVVSGSSTFVSHVAGSKLVGGVPTSVFSESVSGSGTTKDNYLSKDSSGVIYYGNNDASDTLTPALVPYQMVNFPLQAGATFQQVNRSGLDYGSDLDGDGIHERLAIVSQVTVRGFEGVTMTAGAFPDCVRVETDVTETVTLSLSGSRITAKEIDTTWHALDIGPVKRTAIITVNGHRIEADEELTGYLVDSHTSGITVQITPPAASLSVGGSTSFGMTILDANNVPLLTTPAPCTSDNSAVASVDADGVITALATGNAMLTPWVGGVAGTPAVLKVLAGFMPAVQYPESPNSFILGDTAVGDLNGDGRNDVAVLEEFGTHILVYYQNTAGTLNPPVLITTDLNLHGIVIKDVNSDGLADLNVSGNSITALSGWLGRVAVLRQDPGSHALGAAQEYTISTNNVGPLAAADLNGDGLPDLVTAGEGTSGNGVLSFLLQGAGGVLGPEVTYSSVPVVVDGEIHVADMNGDGRNDIVVQSGSLQLAVIRQVSPGAFSATPDFYTVQTGYWPYFRSFALGDLNGDGRTDVAVADLTGDQNIFLQNAGGILSAPQILVLDGQSELKIADIDGDGLNDLIFVGNGNIVHILYQSATHSFQDISTYTLPTQSTGGTSIHQAMSVGDVTGDGLPDIVTSWLNEGIFVLPRKP